MVNQSFDDEIHRRLVLLVARHASVSVESVDVDTSIWQMFPTSYGAEHSSVTLFVEDVHATFNVYLTEEEWEAPTLHDLAQRIRAKRANPAASVTDWNRERATTQKGARTTFVLVNLILVPLAVLSAAGSWTRRLLVALGLLVFMNALLVLLYRKESRRLFSKRPPSSD